MAGNVTSIQILEDGPRNVIIKATGTLDSSDVSLATLVDPALLTGMSPAFPGASLATQLSIEHLDWNITTFVTGALVTPAIQLLWDASTDVVAVNLVGNGKRNYRKLGQALQNNAGAGKTGKILYQTFGWITGATIIYEFELRCVKQGWVG
jgi:hypothetical protein